MMLPFARALLGVCVALLCSTYADAQSSDWQGVLSNLSSPAIDPEKSAITENIEIVRDRVHIVLTEGRIQLMKPTHGVTFAAVFHGQGRLKLEPPNPIEAAQVRLFTKKDAIDMAFTDATFSFTDGLEEDIAKQAKWRNAEAAKDDLYTQRQTIRENLGQSALPRLLQGILAGDRKRTAFFLADLKTADKGWVQVSYDALEAEEISVGRWVEGGAAKDFDEWVSFPAGGVTSAAAWADPRAKEDFAIDAYKIDATVTSGAELTATSLLTLTPRLDGQGVLLFSLDSNLRVDSLKDERGRPVAYLQAQERKDRFQSYGDYVVVILPDPLKSNAQRKLEFHYSGKRAVRRAGNGNYFCESAGWYPERPNSFSARSDFDLTFHSPKSMLLVATGEKLSDTVEGGSEVTHWKSEIPLAVAGFAYGDYKVYSDKAENIAVNIYANREPDDVMAMVQRYFESNQAQGAVGTLTPAAMAKTMGIEMANTIRVFSSYYGPYPYKQLAVTSLPISYSYGQGWPGLIYLWSASFLDSTQRHEIGLKDGYQLTDFFRGHESSHQWWGHRVGWKSYHDQWLSEGFAEFSGNLYVQYRENMKAYRDRWREEKELLKRKDSKGHTVEELGPIWLGQRIVSSETDGASYQDLIYSKGGYVLQMLRLQLWDSRNSDPDHLFKAMMQDYCQTFNNKPASTEDFKAIVEKHMTKNMDVDGNHKMDWFFNEYVYGTGIPQYTFRSTITSTADGKSNVSVTLQRSGVPGNWKDVVPIYAHTGDKMMRLGSITAAHETENVNFTLPQKVDKVTINEYEDLLADVKQ